jgi:hypothetical protein
MPSAKVPLGMGGHHVSDMDPVEVWMLLVLTVLIHGMTFYYVQYVANAFQSQMLLSVTGGVVKGALQTTPRNAPITPVACHMTQSRWDHAPSLRMQSTPRVVYQQLHDTLDVSVFR